MSSAILVLAATLVVALFVISLLSGTKRLPPNTRYPPGPPGKPIVGNLLDIPTQHSWLKFKEWSDQYGPLIRLNLAGKVHYIASTEKIANDLLRERGTLYSSREQSPAAAQLLSDNLRPLLLPYNDVWRNGRKFTHYVTNTTVANSYHSTQILESTRMLRDLIRSPKEYEHWFERYASGLIFRLAFGKTIKTGNEELVGRILKIVHAVERVASPGAYLVDSFPSLMYLPRFVAPFKRELTQLHEQELMLFRGLMEDVREELRNGKAPECWERTFIERQSEFNLTTDQGAYVVGTLFEAGSGTTAAAMMSFILAMIHFPAWLAKLQQEVDYVCGRTRLPNFEDVPNLPNVRAVVKETLRWRPVTAGGAPHQLVKDDVYHDYFIPAGANVHANQWAIHRDPGLYPDPESFNPNRWLDPSFPTYKSPLSVYPNLHNYSAFGFGRRICPGQNIAERSLNILTARIAWACDIAKARDWEGKEVEVPLYDYTTGFNVQPRPFPFDLKVRSQDRLQVIDDELERVMRDDPLKGR
ncbi:cytochrome P450 [Zopfia rhizophila CBS 207.26]|uniref:Cytochrome P450 n=1 Tax=Zopfia rhizophila CBS 207.26 TaxID=1314779 RepID=A0A6A6DK99_9PEZI|nr:cytochrome P450 [Zopfia rhizophila CBS 207.26]